MRPPSNASGVGRVYVWSTMGDRDFSPASTPISIINPPTVTALTANFASQAGIPSTNIAPQGELITLTGTNLDRLTEVRFFGASGTLGTVISSSGTQCVVRVPSTLPLANGTVGAVFVRNIANTATINNITYVARPNITVVRAVLGGSNNPPNTAVGSRKFQVFSPTGGSASTLSRVVRAHFFGENGVRVPLVADPDFDQRYLTCTVPTTATRTSTNDIDTLLVVSPTGYDRFAVKFVNIPRVTGISPNSARPGDVVTLTGTDLDQLTDVRFFGANGVQGKVLASEYTTARVELPAVSPTVNYNQRTGGIFASNIAGSSLSTLNFAIFSTPPVVDSIVPTVVQEGDVIRLFGPNVIEITAVRFFGLNGIVAEITERNARSISVRVPVGTYGRADNLGVFNGFGGSLTSQEVGVSRAPSSVATILPSTFTSGDTIIVSGNDMIFVNEVRFFGANGTPGTIIARSPNSVAVVVPRVTGALSGQLFVRNPIGSTLSIPTASYRSLIADPPVITDVNGIGTTTATLVFTAPTTGRGIASSFRIDIQPTGIATPATIQFNSATAFYTVQLRGLAPGAINTVSVFSVNTTGTSSPATRQFTTLSTSGLPGAPTNLRVTRVVESANGLENIEVGWSPAITGGTPTSYRVNVYQIRRYENGRVEGRIRNVNHAIVSGSQTTVVLRAVFNADPNSTRDDANPAGFNNNNEFIPLPGSRSSWWLDEPSSFGTFMRVIATNATGSVASGAFFQLISIPSKPGTPYSVYQDAGSFQRGVVVRPPGDGINKTTSGFTVSAGIDYNDDRLKVQQFELQLLGSDNNYVTPIETRVLNAQDGVYANGRKYQRSGDVIFTNLTNGQRYVVRMTALNGNGARRSTSITTNIITLVGTNPAPPELLRIADIQIGVTQASFTGRWVALSAAGGTPEGYEVQLSNTSGVMTDTLASNTFTTNVPSYTFSGLSNEALYRFRVRSFNNNKTQFSPWTLSNVTAMQNLRAQDSLTLRMIYANSGGASWRRQSGWNSRFDIDSWQGVIVENDRVVGLVLTNNNMTTLSDSIRRLTALRVLSLRGNRLTTFPAGIRQLRNLQVLELDNNSLSGELGSLSELTNLRVVRVDQNNLTSLASTVFGTSTPMQLFNAENNQLTALPTTLLNATQIRVLAFSNNQIASWSGNVSSLTALRSVLFGNNRLTSIPTFTTNTNLLHFNMQSNRLSGTATTANASLARNSAITYLIDRQTSLVQSQANTTDDFLAPMMSISRQTLSANGVDVAVYPIPAQSEISVRLQVSISGMYRMALCDMQGKEVIAPSEYVLADGEHTLRFATNHLPNGTYMLTVVTPSAIGKPLRYPVMIVR